MASQYLKTESKILVYGRMDSAFPINFNRTFEITNSFSEVQMFMEQHPKGFILTNTRNKKVIKELGKYKLILKQKALFENHVTRIYTK